ncbi:DUF1649-domain-containing protein [Polychaeton citri CBS 116435]|uniref:Autophagy-related protein 101 n=1 Tax=Polychaeton citri CBS 116435 TaxID=1314669 RepID=A0A9P4Q4W5_9PEZI|nr:DUF1649-domain-containing protein [Polychaeton citri CBS 116435]
MEARRAPEYTLEVSADRGSVKEVIRGLLHTIFFHRFFTTLYPATHDVFDLTLPYVSDTDLESLIDTRAVSLLRQLDPTSHQSSPQYNQRAGRCTVQVQFLEKKRKKGWFVAKADEETVWEVWTIEVTQTISRNETEATRNRRIMERELRKAALKVLSICARDKGHIPPITTNDSNPFPYQIVVNPKSEGWGQKIGGIF